MTSTQLSRNAPRQDEYKDEPGSVITADFYHANELMPLSDEQVVARARSHLEACEPGFRGAQLLDSIVLRFPKAVTHFSPGACHTFIRTCNCSCSQISL